MKRFQAAVLAVTAILVACGGGNICDSTERVQKAFSDKLAPCASADGGSSVTVSGSAKGYSRATCEAQKSACTGDDISKMNDTASCIEKSASCNKENLFGSLIFLSLCTLPTQAISNPCKLAIGIPVDAGN